MINSIFGDMFDLNNDGNLDTFEQGLEFMFINEFTKEESDDSDNLEAVKYNPEDNISGFILGKNQIT